MTYLDIAIEAMRQLIEQNREKETALFDQYGQWAEVSTELVAIHKESNELVDQLARLWEEKGEHSSN